MRTHSFLTRTASIAACFGILFTSQIAAAGNGRSGVVRDVELSADGMLHGRVLNSEGVATPGTLVELRYQGAAVARAKTSADGRFVVSDVRGGAHEIAVAEGTTAVRLWKRGTAPEGSVAGVVLSSETAVRGQGATAGLGMLDVITLTSVGLGGAGVFYGIDNNNKLDDVEEQIKMMASP
jgi:hypothetical protein